MTQTRKANRKYRSYMKKRRTKAMRKVGGTSNVNVKLDEIYAKVNDSITTKNSVYELYLKPTGDIITYYVDGINDYLKTIMGQMNGKFVREAITDKPTTT